MIGFYLFCIRWLWRHMDWAETRQKYKALDRDLRKAGFGGLIR